MLTLTTAQALALFTAFGMQVLFASSYHRMMHAERWPVIFWIVATIALALAPVSLAFLAGAER